MIIERTSYIGNLRENEKVNSFHTLLFGGKTKENNNTDFDKLILSVQNSDKESFSSIIEEYEAREPSADSPFVNDNYLLFLLIFGAKKFALDLDWIIKILDIRKSTNEDSILISTTFKNIIEDNFKSKSNDFGVIMTYEYLIDDKLITWEERKYFYSKLVERPFPFYSDDLLNLMALKAYDIVILEGDEQRESKFNALQGFESRFLKSVGTYSLILQWISIIFFVGAFIYSYYEYNTFKNIVKDNLFIAGLLGVGGMIATFLFKGKLRNIFKSLLYRVWGYNTKNKDS